LAQGFWEKIGIGVQNHGEGAAYSDTLTREAFLASTAGQNTRTARSSPRNAEGKNSSQHCCEEYAGARYC
jgi:hypothetical protein